MTTYCTPLSAHRLPAEQVGAEDATAREVIGYYFDGSTYCPRDMIAALPSAAGEAFDGWELAKGVRMCPEANLNEIAWAFGINRADQTSFDPQEFPHVLLAQDVTSPDDAQVDGSHPSACCVCHEDLLE